MTKEQNCSNCINHYFNYLYRVIICKIIEENVEYRNCNLYDENNHCKFYEEMSDKEKLND